MIEMMALKLKNNPSMLVTTTVTKCFFIGNNSCNATIGADF
jgi:hypothetical protein